MDEAVRNDLTQQFLLALQGMHGKPQGPHASDRMRGAPMILHYIKAHGGGVSPGEISKKMGTSNARVAAVLGNLEKKGLLVRTMDEEDRRKIRVTLTEQGQEYVQKMEQAVLEQMRGLVDYLGEEDARAAIRLMMRLKDWKPENDCNQAGMELMVD